MAARILFGLLFMIGVLAAPAPQVAANGCCGKSEDHPHPNDNANNAAREADRLRELERARIRQREALDQRTRSQDRLRGRVGNTGPRVLSNPSTGSTTNPGTLQGTIQSLGEIIRRQREAEERERERAEREAARKPPAKGDPPYAESADRPAGAATRTSAVDIDNPPPPPPLKPLFPVWPDRGPATARPPMAPPVDTPPPGEMAAKPEGAENPTAATGSDTATGATTATTDADTGQPTDSAGRTEVTTLGPDGQPADPTKPTTNTTEAGGEPPTDSSGATEVTSLGPDGQPVDPTASTTNTTDTEGEPSTDSTGETEVTTLGPDGQPVDPETGQPTGSTDPTGATTAGEPESQGPTPPTTDAETGQPVDAAALTPPLTSDAGSAQSSAAPNPDGTAAPESLPTITELPPAPPPVSVVHTTIPGPDGKPVDVFVIDGKAETLDELKDQMSRAMAESQGDYNTAWWLNKPAGVATEVVAFGGEVYVGVTLGPLAAAGAVFVKGTAQEASSRVLIEGYARDKDKKDAAGNQAMFSGPVAGPIGAGLQDAAVNLAFDGMFHAGGKIMGTAGDFLEKPVSEAVQAAKDTIQEVGEQSARGLRHAKETFERSAQAAREAAAPGQRELAEKLARTREIAENLDRMSMQERAKAAAELGAANEGKMTLRQAAARETRALREALHSSREAVERQIDDAASKLLDRRNTIMRARAQAVEAAQSKRNWDIGMAVAEETVGELAEGEYSPFVQGVMFGDGKQKSAPKAVAR